ncbi:hypothetical protein [uncultured Pseudacidovorax sp.]|uniref:hypothetical protein n=1 Tax=uncultured Pseudacidovorax sp. TaxID=679313 RepID=UPI0025F39457|nr:hypothetical protein [uncultured Pseudacidovorax sp.]
MKGVIPSLPEIGRETLIIMAGALLAALIMSRFPKLQAFVQQNTAFGGGCSCQDKPTTPTLI